MSPMPFLVLSRRGSPFAFQGMACQWVGPCKQVHGAVPWQLPHLLRGQGAHQRVVFFDTRSQAGVSEQAFVC